MALGPVIFAVTLAKFLRIHRVLNDAFEADVCAILGQLGVKTSPNFQTVPR
jgi:hypothetical protein